MDERQQSRGSIRVNGLPRVRIPRADATRRKELFRIALGAVSVAHGGG